METTASFEARSAPRSYPTIMTLCAFAYLTHRLRNLHRIRRPEHIPQETLAAFQSHGVTVIQFALAGGFQPASHALKKLNIHSDEKVQQHALLWLTERSDESTQHDERIEIIEWALLFFLCLSLLVELVSLFAVALHAP